MRVNVYAEEIMLDVKPVEEKRPEASERAYTAVRFYLASPNVLPYTAEDDSRSAVTFWGNKEMLRMLFTKALKTLDA